MIFQPSSYTWPVGLTDPALWVPVQNMPIASVDDKPLDPVFGGVFSNIFAIAVESSDNPNWYRAGWANIGLPNFADGGLGNAPFMQFSSIPLALNQAQIVQMPNPGDVGSATFNYSISFVRWLRSATVRSWEFIG